MSQIFADRGQLSAVGRPPIAAVPEVLEGPHPAEGGQPSAISGQPNAVDRTPNAERHRPSAERRQPNASKHFFLTFGGMKTFCLNRRFLLLGFGLMLFFGTACSSQKPTELSFELLPADFVPMYNELPANLYVVQSQAEWDSLSARLQLQSSQNEMDLTSYFATHTLLLVYGGWQRTTGYQLDTKSLTQTGKLVTVQAKLSTPGEGCLMADMITFPMQLIAVPKGKKRTYGLQMQAESKNCR